MSDPRFPLRFHFTFGAAALLVAVGLSAGCATVAGESGPSFAEGKTPAFATSAPSPEAAAILTALYGPGADPVGLSARVEAALATHPQDPDLHEAAGYLAILHGDSDASELHFAQAALDSRAAAPRLFLQGLDPNHEIAVDAAREVVAHSPDPELRAVAHQILLASARQRLDPEAAATELAALGVLDHWKVLGAFDNDEGKGFLNRYPPEQTLDLGATVPGILVPVRWRPVESLGRYGELPFEGMIWPARNAVAYAVTFLTVPAAQDAVLWLSSGEPIRVFIDGKLAMSHETVVGGAMDNFALKLHLGPGTHTLLLKSANKNSRWSVRACLRTPDGAPVPGLVTSGEPAAAGPAPTVTFEEVPGVHGLASGLSETRMHFLAARMAYRSGDAKLAVREATQFATLAPGNPLALWVLASASGANEEQGKQLDLLNEGVKRFDAALPEFRATRARVYVEKSLLDKAQADVEAFLAARPNDREGLMLLADVEAKRNFSVEARLTLEKAVQAYPRQLRPLRQLAFSELDQGHTQKALDLLDRARQLAPGDEDTLWFQYELARRTYDTTLAAEFNASRRANDPSWAGLWVEAGETAERAGDRTSAQAFYARANVLSPDQPFPLAHLAELAFQSGDVTEATRLWTEASARAPADGLLSERLEHLNPTRLGFIEKFVPTDEAIDEATRAGEKLVPQDGSQVVMLLDDMVTEVHSDGSSTNVVTTVERAINDQGRDSLIQAHVPTYGRLKLLKAYAVSKEGERQEAASVRNGAFRFRNLKVGSTVVLQYVHYAPAAHFLPNEYVGSWSFQSVAREARRSHWVVALPKGRVLHLQFHGQSKHTVVDEGAYTVHEFLAENVTPLVEEPSSPPLHDQLLGVSVSTVPSWEDYARWERALLADAFQESNDLGGLAQKLTEGSKTPREKLDKLTTYVAEQIRYQMDYENSIAGVRPHSTRQILERGYADCKDKAVLLISLAKEVGIKLDFVDVRTRTVGATEREVPNQQFNHAIVYVPVQEGFPEAFFVDATTDALDVGSLREDDQGSLSLVLDPTQKDGFDFVPIPFRAPADEYIKSDIQMDVAAGGKVTVTDALKLRGSMASSARRTLKNPAYAHKFEEQFAGYLFPGSTLLSAKAGDPSDVWNPIGLEMELDDSAALDASASTHRLRLPSVMGIEQLTALAERRLPLELGIPKTIEMHVGVKVPAGQEITETPEDFDEKATCLEIQRTSKAKPSGDLDETLRVTFTCHEVSTTDYPAFRAQIIKVVGKLDQRLAFADKASPPKKAKH